MTPLRSLFVVAAIVGVIVLTSSPEPRPAADAELSRLWQDSADIEWNRRLDSRTAVMVERIDQKARIVDDVRAGRVTRAAAVAQFRELLVADPELLDDYRARSPGLTDDELALENFVRHLSVTDKSE